MPPNQRRFVAAVLLLAATAIGTYWLPRRRVAAGVPIPRLAALIPTAVGDWAGREVAVPPAVAAYLQSEQTLARDYRRAGQPVIHLLVAAGRDWRATHSPRSCLQALGCSIDSERAVRLDLPPGGQPLPPLNVLVLTAHQSGRSPLIAVFSFVTPRGTTAEQARHAWNMMREGRETGALLLLASVETTGASPQEVTEICGFVRLVYMHAASAWLYSTRSGAHGGGVLGAGRR